MQKRRTYLVSSVTCDYNSTSHSKLKCTFSTKIITGRLVKALESLPISPLSFSSFPLPSSDSIGNLWFHHLFAKDNQGVCPQTPPSPPENPRKASRHSFSAYCTNMDKPFSSHLRFRHSLPRPNRQNLFPFSLDITLCRCHNIGTFVRRTFVLFGGSHGCHEKAGNPFRRGKI